MAGDYYYFCSQLPTLRVGVVAPSTLADFDAHARCFLPSSEADYLEQCQYPPTREFEVKATSAYARYRAWEFALRGEIAKLRAANGNITAFKVPAECVDFSTIKDQLGTIVAIANPLERERRLDALRFQYLDELESSCRFSRDMAVCYRIRLSILEKYRDFEQETGRKEFGSAIDTIDANSVE